MENAVKDLKMEHLPHRYLNEGFSGGEKRNEILQMKMLEPAFAILMRSIRTDIDALKIVGENINRMRGPDFGALIITHCRIFDYVDVDYVHIMLDG